MHSSLTLAHPASESFTALLLDWFEANQRDLPWRHTHDAYHIWLSEIILQQTRVQQGLPYYERFVSAYPTIQDLAQAPEQEVLRLWQGLGYYSRARNMHAAARYIWEELGGQFPDNYQALLQLKGVGKYTAAAIAAFAFGEPVAVVDGNVYRVLSRVFGIETDIAQSNAHQVFAAVAQAHLPPTDAARYNQALMEFGALHCTPAKPNCLFCPMQAECVAFAKGWQQKLPIKTKKITQKTRYFHYLVWEFEGQLALRERQDKDVWQGLYDFALYEHPQRQTPEEVLAHIAPPSLATLQSRSKVYKHLLTHQKIYAQFWHFKLHQKPENLPHSQGIQWFDAAAYEALPKPILIHNYLQDIFAN
ncbi:A/G-specific adenine glycosylase [Eisenibacter elegans]|uniref:A/G-specific adenine glycosylase n=1 Tax=Eisenibacter elegans TaxID=997 RepID=UPI0006862B6A|nr:A/G-specific adenine glycosylase [Eisenibacter elegans]